MGVEIDYVNIDENQKLKFDEIFDKLSKTYSCIMVEGGSGVITKYRLIFL